MERSNRLTSGNVSHGSKAIHGVAKNCAEYIDEHLQNRWKPSDEQMVTLSEASGIVGMFTPRGTILKSLYNNLKNLKE